jgi:hypothetical protein
MSPPTTFTQHDLTEAILAERKRCQEIYLAVMQHLMFIYVKGGSVSAERYVSVLDEMAVEFDQRAAQMCGYASHPDLLKRRDVFS